MTIFPLFRQFIDRLPDKGEKIKSLYDRIVEALEYRTDIEYASKLLSKLNIGSSNLNNLEWEGSIHTKKQQQLDSDDEEQDPLEILASSNSTFKNQKIVKKSNDPNEKPLITEEDIKEAKEILNGELHLDPVDEKICEREKLDSDHRFLPYKSTEFKKKQDSDKVEKEKKEPKIRDVTAATPPVITKGTVALTLKESLDIEHHHQTVMKQLLEKQAVERLEAKMKEMKALGLDTTALSESMPKSKNLSMKKYRLPDPVFDELIEDDEDKSDDSLTDEEDDEY